MATKRPSLPSPSLLLALCLALAIASAVSLTSCSDDEPYPNVVTELVDCITDGQGTMVYLVTDDNVSYTLTNPQQGLIPNALYRCLCGYTTDGQSSATLYSLTGAYLLRDSTAVKQADPINVLSAWMTNRYVNLHLTVLTQGGEHTLGYAIDSISPDHERTYISLHHSRQGDPEVYTTDLYASIPLDSLPTPAVTLLHDGHSYDFQRR